MCFYEPLFISTFGAILITSNVIVTTVIYVIYCINHKNCCISKLAKVLFKKAFYYLIDLYMQ